MNNNKLNKKKGRKPVAKVLDKNNIKNIINDNKNECLIVHIPVSIDKINSYNKKKNNNIIVNENGNSSLNGNSSINKKYSLNNEIFQSKPKLFTEENKLNYLKGNSKEKELIEQIDILKNHIKLLEQKNKNILSSNFSSCNLFNNNIKPNKNLVCWWCSHKFNNHPVYLPESKLNDTYNVYGYFCSFNCAMAFNIELNDYKVWERSNYLNQLYYNLHKKYFTIKPAPSRYSLDIYGGEYDINTFRNKFIYSDKEFRYIIPPIKSIIPKFEEINTNNVYLINDNLNKLKDNLVLKRTKPITKYSNPIEKAMNLKKLS